MVSLLKWMKHKFSCEYCGASFGSLDALMNHLRSNPTHDI